MIFLFYLYVFNKAKLNELQIVNRLVSVLTFRNLKYLIPFLLLSVASTSMLFNRHEEIVFKVVRKNKEIGYITINRSSLNRKTTYSLSSEVNATFILNFKAKGMEKSIYENDVLVFSSMYRTINDRLKLDQTLRLINGNYLFTNRSEQQFLHLDEIHQNLVTLFFKEPVNINKIYSDKFKQTVNIEHLGHGKYMITLPDNSTSVYHYRYGQCILIELKGSFYKVDLVRFTKKVNYNTN